MHLYWRFELNWMKLEAEKCAVVNASPTDIEIKGAHIIKRSLAKEDGLEAGIVGIGLFCRYHSVRLWQTGSLSLSPTWDIIHHYANIPVDNLENSLDSPENGNFLEISMHRAFERFEWCLCPNCKPRILCIHSLKAHCSICKGNKTNTTWSGFDTPSTSSALLDGKLWRFKINPTSLLFRFPNPSI